MLLQLLTLILTLLELFVESSLVFRLGIVLLRCAKEHPSKLVKALGKLLVFLLTQHKAHQQTFCFLRVDLGGADLVLKVSNLVARCFCENISLGKLGVLRSELGYLGIHFFLCKFIKWSDFSLLQSGLQSFYNSFILGHHLVKLAFVN